MSPRCTVQQCNVTDDVLVVESTLMDHVGSTIIRLYRLWWADVHCISEMTRLFSSQQLAHQTKGNWYIEGKVSIVCNILCFRTTRAMSSFVFVFG